MLLTPFPTVPTVSTVRIRLRSFSGTNSNQRAGLHSVRVSGKNLSIHSGTEVRLTPVEVGFCLFSLKHDFTLPDL
jgi:hypothetical protein